MYIIGGSIKQSRTPSILSCSETKSSTNNEVYDIFDSKNGYRCIMIKFLGYFELFRKLTHSSFHDYGEVLVDFVSHFIQSFAREIV